MLEMCFFAVAILALTAGTCIGVASERKAWKARALTRSAPNGAAHHCDGQFYYVITEECFVNDFQRKPGQPAKGAGP